MAPFLFYKPHLDRRPILQQRLKTPQPNNALPARQKKNAALQK
ncbi:hypothetical protein RTCIAT899_CH07075 [Rhizobium tropici CIAT 899]|nr:hypothetical protein RTCIAT899_CH07075 [Rhizobium tropici CIAT 899]